MNYMVITYHDSFKGSDIDTSYAYRFSNLDDAIKFLIDSAYERFKRYVDIAGAENSSIKINNGSYARVYGKFNSIETNWYWELFKVNGVD